MMLIEDRGGTPWPALAEPSGGEVRVADGVRYFTPEQAAVRWPQFTVEQFVDYSLATWGDVLPPSAPRSRKGIKTKDVDDMELRRKLQFPHLTPEEFRWFCSECEARGLNVRANHAWAKKAFVANENRHDVKILCTIDGMRAIAMRTREYVGQELPQVLYGDTSRPIRVNVTLYRKINGERCAFHGTATWEEYAPLGNDRKFWEGAAEIMLSKCAEAIAFRKAFPELLSGLYEQSEFSRDRGTSKPKPPTDDDAPPPLIEPPPMTMFGLHLALSDAGCKDEKKRNDIVEQFKATWLGLRDNDEPEFCRRAIKAVLAKPGRYGINAVGGPA